MRHNGCNFRPLNYISKVHLKFMVTDSPKLSCKCPHLIKLEFAYIKKRELTNEGAEFRCKFCREFWCKSRVNFRAKKCS